MRLDYYKGRVLKYAIIFRDNWEDIMKNKIKIPITLEVMENAAKVAI